MSIFGHGRKDEEPKGTGKKPEFYSWDKSATGQFFEKELPWLRDEHPEKIAEAIWEPGRGVQQYTLFELLAHGSPRKAALVARSLVRQHPIAETSLRKDVGDQITDYLLKTDLLKLPSKPEEYPPS